MAILFALLLTSFQELGKHAKGFFVVIFFDVCAAQIGFLHIWSQMQLHLELLVKR